MPHRSTWTVSMPHNLRRVAEQAACQERRTKSALVREALWLYLTQPNQLLKLAPGERIVRVGEFLEASRSRKSLPQPTEAELFQRFRGVRLLHDRLKHLRPS